MEKPFFSIIIPIFNSGQVLGECVNSILLQEYTNFEIILINDGSSDNSEEICKSFIEKDYRIKYFKQENKGVSAARNMGIEKANGEFILFCDSDDKTLPQWISQFVPYLYEYDLISAGYFSKYSDGNLNKMSIGELDDKEIIIFLLDNTSMLGYLWCKCFKRNIIIKNKIRFNENLKLMEDLDFIYKYLMHSNKAKSIIDCNYIYYVPNYAIKYKHTTTLESIYSICSSLNSLELNKSFHEHILYKYLRLAENELIKAYKYKSNNYKNVISFLSIINDFGHYYTDRFIFRIIYKLFSKPKYSFLVHSILNSKYFLNRCLKF